LLVRLTSPNRLRLQVFSTSWRLHPPRAWWPCFMPHPLMGLRPSEPCSSRAAVRRLRRLLPSCRSDEPAPSSTRTANGRNRPPHAPPRDPTGRSRRAPAARHPPAEADEHPTTGDSWPKPPATTGFPKPNRERPHLQGFAPHESPPPTTGGLDRRRARSSPGLHTLQGSLPHWIAATFAAAPLMGFVSLGRKRPTELALQGLTSSELGWSLSRLPALLGFAAF